MRGRNWKGRTCCAVMNAARTVGGKADSCRKESERDLGGGLRNIF